MKTFQINTWTGLPSASHWYQNQGLHSSTINPIDIDKHWTRNDSYWVHSYSVFPLSIQLVELIVRSTLFHCKTHCFRLIAIMCGLSAMYFVIDNLVVFFPESRWLFAPLFNQYSELSLTFGYSFAWFWYAIGVLFAMNPVQCLIACYAETQIDYVPEFIQAK